MFITIKENTNNQEHQFKIIIEDTFNSYEEKYFNVTVNINNGNEYERK